MLAWTPVPWRRLLRRRARGGPFAGLAIARSVAQITYRSNEVFDNRFARDLVDPRALFGPLGPFQVESYLDYHGEKLVRRFDANSYLVLTRGMDLHDLAVIVAAWTSPWAPSPTPGAHLRSVPTPCIRPANRRLSVTPSGGPEGAVTTM
ncbi:MAG: hypothetical protein CM1200mP26_30700 [Acidimicrobiales bacterium]|nr:MAG: hypothetical protein CM1200mP26_30700 [Acidimicrobiales bacterium]